MAKKKKILIGDLFSYAVSETERIFGRVLFDVTSQYMKRVAPEDRRNSLDFFNKCFLVELFKGVACSLSEIDMNKKAVVSYFVSGNFFDNNECEIIGNEKVDPTKVSFPEYLSSFHPDFFFSTGEIRLPIQITGKEYDEIKVHPSFGNGYTGVLTTLFDSDRADLLDREWPVQNYLRFSDMRTLPEIREKIYRMIGEDPNQSYYELALKHGFDLARFY